MHLCLHLVLFLLSEFVRFSTCARSVTETSNLRADSTSGNTPLEVAYDFLPKKESIKSKADHFLNSWDFYDGPDPTYGHVRYLNKSEAMAHIPRALVNIDDNTGHAFLYSEPDHEIHKAPRTLRLESKYKMDANQLLVGDFRHFPDLCGSWPAFWLLGEGPWPRNGEVDIVENVGGELPIVNEQTHTALHTEQSCHVGHERESHFMNHGLFWKKDCAWKWGKNAEGCTILRIDRHSFGRKFNEMKGGAYAMLWTDSFFEMWFWPRAKVPKDVTSGVISVESMKDWGLPYARFNLGNLCSPKLFRNMSIIINTAFCGGFAGKTFKTMCPSNGQWKNGASFWHSHTADENCVKFFSGKGGREDVREKAFWEIDSLRVYKYPHPAKPKYGDLLFPVLSPGVEWCRNPTRPDWKVEDVKKNQCVAYMNKGSHEEFRIGHVTKVTEPICASLPGARTATSAEELKLSDDDDDEELPYPSPSLVELNHEFVQIESETAEMPSFLEVDSSAETQQTGLQASCHQSNQEYGNWMNGACGASNTLSLHADEGCLESLSTQDWFNKSAQLVNASGMTLQSCQAACVKMGRDCGFYNYHTGKAWCPSSCWLKSSLRCGAKGYTYASGWISGPRQCPHKKSLCTITYDVPSATRSEMKQKTSTELLCFNSEAACPSGCRWQDGRCMKAM